MRKLIGQMFPQRQKNVGERITAKLSAERWLSTTETSYKKAGNVIVNGCNEKLVHIEAIETPSLEEAD